MTMTAAWGRRPGTCHDLAQLASTPTRRELFARIAMRARTEDVCRAERLLLRGLERQWPEDRIERLLQGLWLKAVLQTVPADVP